MAEHQSGGVKLRLLTSRTKRNRGQIESTIQIKCCDCQVPYIGETGRNLSMRLTDANEGQKVVTLRSHYIAEHDLKNIKSTENQ